MITFDLIFPFFSLSNWLSVTPDTISSLFPAWLSMFVSRQVFVERRMKAAEMFFIFCVFICRQSDDDDDFDLMLRVSTFMSCLACQYCFSNQRVLVSIIAFYFPFRRSRRFSVVEWKDELWWTTTYVCNLFVIKGNEEKGFELDCEMVYFRLPVL